MMSPATKPDGACSFRFRSQEPCRAPIVPLQVESHEGWEREKETTSVQLNQANGKKDESKSSAFNGEYSMFGVDQRRFVEDSWGCTSHERVWCVILQLQTAQENCLLSHFRIWCVVCKQAGGLAVTRLAAMWGQTRRRQCKFSVSAEPRQWVSEG